MLTNQMIHNSILQDWIEGLASLPITIKRLCLLNGWTDYGAIDIKDIPYV